MATFLSIRWTTSHSGRGNNRVRASKNTEILALTLLPLRERIEDAGLAAHVSVASLWEIAIKVSLNKLTLPGEFETLFPSSVPQSGLTLLPIAVAHIAAVRRLEHHHRDPFDRLLIAQAKT